MSSTKSRVLVLVQSCQVESWGLGALLWCLFSMPVLYSVLRALCYSLELVHTWKPPNERFVALDPERNSRYV